MTAAPDPFDSQFAYVTTTGRKTGLPRQIEIWFVEYNNCVYIFAEQGPEAHWVKNLAANPSARIRINDREWQATARVLDAAREAQLCEKVRGLARAKYGWGEGLPVEFQLDREIIE